MRAAEALIEEIVASCQIPSKRRRREVVRELRAHVDDFVQAERQAGHTDDEIERMVLAKFGDPRQIGMNFAWVYRRERAVLRFSVFGLCTLSVAGLITAAVLALQAGAAIGFGNRPLTVVSTRHTLIEAVNILTTVAAYVGLRSLENLFDRRGFQKALALLSVIFAILTCGSAIVGGRTFCLVFGFANAVFLRTAQRFLRSWMARLSAVLAYFELCGLIFLWLRSPALQYSIAPSLVSWLIMGAGYQLMTGFAARFDRELSSRLQEF